MKEQVEIIIPELREEGLKQVVRNNILMRNLSLENQKDLVMIIICKFNVFYKCMYFDGNDQENQIAAWRAGLCDLTTRQIFGGLLRCLTGKTQYTDFPPTNVIAFHCVCKDAEFPRDYFEALPALEHERTEASKSAAQDAIIKMREMLGGNKKGNLYRIGSKAEVLEIEPSSNP